MRSLDTIQKLSKIGKVLSKIAFIFSVIGVCGCIAGLLSLSFSGENLLKIGSVTLHGLFSDHLALSKSATAALAGWLIVCAGEAVVAKFAETYFKREQQAGTPFTLAGAKELLRLGILTIAIPVGCAALGGIAEGAVAGFMNVEQAAVTDLYLDNEANIALGVMFMVLSQLCRYGAELTHGDEAHG